MSLIAGSDIAVELTRPRPVSEPGWRARELLSTAFPLVDAIAAKARRLQSDIAAWTRKRRSTTARTGMTRRARAKPRRRAHPLDRRHAAALSPAVQSSVSVINISAYQAQFRPSASSTLRSRLPTSSIKRGVHPEQAPWQMVPFVSTASGTRITTGAPLVPRCVRAWVGNSPALETQPERGSEHRIAHHRHVMQRVMESQGKTDDQQRGSDFDMIAGMS